MLQIELHHVLRSVFPYLNAFVKPSPCIQGCIGRCSIATIMITQNPTAIPLSLSQATLIPESTNSVQKSDIHQINDHDKIVYLKRRPQPTRYHFKQHTKSKSKTRPTHPLSPTTFFSNTSRLHSLFSPTLKYVQPTIGGVPERCTGM